MITEVIRGAGILPAPDVIYEPLAITEVVRRDRGMRYLYDEGFDKRIYELTLPYTGVKYPYDTITVYDSAIAESFTGRVLSHTISGVVDEDGTVEITSTITVERSIEKG